MAHLAGNTSGVLNSTSDWLDQGSQTLSWSFPNTAHLACLLYQSHLIQLISSLVATPRPEMGVPDKGDMQNVQCWGGSRNVFRNPWVILYRISGRRVSRSLTFCLETKMPWRQTPSRKKKAVVFTNVTASAYQVNKTLEFPKYVKYLKFAA